jgi:predicted DNA-binding transcriptional regulator AlpA
MSKSPRKVSASEGAALRRRFQLLLPAEVATMLDVSESAITNWRNDNTGPEWIRLGRRVYYREVDLLEWFAENRMRGYASEPNAEQPPQEP